MINRRMFSASLAGAAASFMTAASHAQSPQPASRPGGGARNVVLVHGAYADGSCWTEVIARLQAAGLKPTAVQNPLTSLADDVAATRRILALQDGPTVLVGHSSAGLVTSGGFAQLSEEAFLRDFAGDIDPVKARVLYAVQGRVAPTLFGGRTTVAAWRSKPSWYQVSTEDRTIDPDLERFLAKRMGAKTIELPSSHLGLISHPDEITALILEAARA
jgi:pimeloyl-ACP methyl ester carboxylesterase